MMRIRRISMADLSEKKRVALKAQYNHIINQTTDPNLTKPEIVSDLTPAFSKDELRAADRIEVVDGNDIYILKDRHGPSPRIDKLV